MIVSTSDPAILEKYKQEKIVWTKPSYDAFGNKQPRPMKAGDFSSHFNETQIDFLLAACPHLKDREKEIRRALMPLEKLQITGEIAHVKLWCDLGWDIPLNFEAEVNWRWNRKTAFIEPFDPPPDLTSYSHAERQELQREELNKQAANRKKQIAAGLAAAAFFYFNL